MALRKLSVDEQSGCFVLSKPTIIDIPRPRREPLSVLLVDNLAIGGFSTVLEGVLWNGDKVALKYPMADSWSTAKREYEILSGLHRANTRIKCAIVTLLEVFIDEGLYVLVFPLYKPLSNLFPKPKGDSEENTWFSHEQAVKIMYELLVAVHFVHSNNLAHNDIKVDNILVNHNMRPRLADFGLANPFEEHMVVGTKAYRSPENLMGSGCGVKSDIWALGCTFFYVLTGRDVVTDEKFIMDDRVLFAFLLLRTGTTLDHPCLQKCMTKGLLDLPLPRVNPKPRQFSVKRAHIKDSDDLRGLICKLMEFDENARIGIEEAMNLPLFQELPKWMKTMGNAVLALSAQKK